MSLTRAFLIFSVLLWLPYGLYLMFQPGYLSEIAGLQGATPTGITELRAMYGGLQAALGAFAVAALTECAVTAARWRRIRGDAATTVAFPGGTE